MSGKTPNWLQHGTIRSNICTRDNVGGDILVARGNGSPRVDNLDPESSTEQGELGRSTTAGIMDIPQSSTRKLRSGVWEARQGGKGGE